MGTVTRIDAINRGWNKEVSGMCQEQRENEERAAAITFSSIDSLLADLDRAAAISILRRDQLLELKAVVLDYMPGRESWRHAIDEAKHGY